MEAEELLMLFLGVWSAVSVIVGGYVLYLAITDRDD
jgi:hypothetical protein